MHPKRRRKIRWQQKRATTWSAQPTPKNAQAQYLSGLNVLQELQDHANDYLASKLVYGPATFAGDGWASALVWYRHKGYQHFKSMILFGVWVHDNTSDRQVSIAKKPLQFQAAHFNPESYFAVIQRDFRSYYNDDGSPPDEQDILWQASATETTRLDMRRTVADALVKALQTLASDDAPTN
ncbi:MAG: hypothetical protein AAFQ07_07560 [Chloroflexota bacterium]